MTPSTEQPLYVGVCGAGTPMIHDEEAWAEEVGRLLAREGAVVVCGGMTGVMDAVARGVAQEGGVSIGILPGLDRDGASPHVTYTIPSGMGEARNTVLVRSADAVVAIAGEFGTLSEIALALKIGIPVVGLKTWELHKSGEAVDAFELAETPDEAVRKAMAAARRHRARD